MEVRQAAVLRPLLCGQRLDLNQGNKGYDTARAFFHAKPQLLAQIDAAAPSGDTTANVTGATLLARAVLRVSRVPKAQIRLGA
ncbi:hypothetical protein E0H30_36030 [Rhizobium leguminosarum bv. viciae]|nr:hypothetical protein E0H30_36030 [Rhizobium leguminosarum bv. viciae]